MRWFYLAALCTTCLMQSFAQNVGIGTNTPHSSAQLEIAHTSKGILIPRMITADINAISNPAKGLLVYDSSKNQLMVNMGSPTTPFWQNIVFNSGWTLGGNTGTNPNNQFIGTTDNKPIKFRINNGYTGKLDTNGSVAFGRGALFNDLPSNINTAIGDSALFNNGTAGFWGYGNTAVGNKTLFKNTLGSTNTAVGTDALLNNIDGMDNTAVGAYSLTTNNSGSYNTGMGRGALGLNTTGSANTAVGYGSLGQNWIGTRNSAFGFYSLLRNFQGDYNAAMGFNSLAFNLGGSYNVAVGSHALYSNQNNKNLVAIGDSALYYNGIDNSFWGDDNVGIGKKSLFLNRTGIRNVSIGSNAGENSLGNYNLFLGFQSGLSNTTGGQNTLVGSFANVIQNNLINATAIGYNARVGSHNSVSIGDTANNTLVGIGTAYPSKAGLVVNQTVGAVHAMFGSYVNGVAIESNWPGIGFNSYYNGGRRFISNGYAGIINLDPGNGWLHFFINGSGNRDALVPLNKGFIFVNGAGNAASLIPSADNNYTLGSASNRWTTIYATNNIINTSDAREKESIVPIRYGLEEVMKLNPVSFKWKNADAGSQTMLGLLAQEVQPIIPEIVTDQDGRLGMRSTELIPVLIKAVQEQQQVIDELRKNNTFQKTIIAELIKRVESVETKIRSGNN